MLSSLMPWTLGSQKAAGICLLSKTITKKPTNLKAMKSVLCRVWQLYEDMDIQEVGERLWLFHFSALKDKLKVLIQQPWSFNRVFIMFRDYDCEIPVPVDEYDFCWGFFWLHIQNVPLKFFF